jgi:hypothetical protein
MIFDADVLVVNMGPDTNYFNVQDVNTQKMYTLERSAARYYESIRPEQILNVMLSSNGYVMCVHYREHDKLVEKLSGKSATFDYQE